MELLCDLFLPIVQSQALEEHNTLCNAFSDIDGATAAAAAVALVADDDDDDELSELCVCIVTREEMNVITIIVNRMQLVCMTTKELYT